MFTPGGNNSYTEANKLCLIQIGKLTIDEVRINLTVMSLQLLNSHIFHSSYICMNILRDSSMKGQVYVKHQFL